MSREYPCVYFNNQKCRKFEEPGYVSWCVMGPCAHETPSNGDWVRRMEDDELALFLAERMAKQDFMRLEDEGTKLSEAQKKALVERLYFTWLRWLIAPEVKNENPS